MGQSPQVLPHFYFIWLHIPMAIDLEPTAAPNNAAPTVNIATTTAAAYAFRDSSYLIAGLNWG